MVRTSAASWGVEMGDESGCRMMFHLSPVVDVCRAISLSALVEHSRGVDVVVVLVVVLAVLVLVVVVLAVLMVVVVMLMVVEAFKFAPASACPSS